MSEIDRVQPIHPTAQTVHQVQRTAEQGGRGGHNQQEPPSDVVELHTAEKEVEVVETAEEPEEEGHIDLTI